LIDNNTDALIDDIASDLMDDGVDGLIDRPKALITKGFQSFGMGKIPTFIDSGASDTMFVSRDSFTEYKPISPRTGDSAKA
jgi:hypothetical protein